ncbi:LruC domain-containing protein [uncultured Parabacteroides sp.]|uniref:LruC domain-containing protein n=1 Tax=uncultured Parabacteroides sp. TaxID=512312 RepID=UPI002638211B|nr:LruC domain-containing protein [uncultured Parabacteroides sp.]
MVLALFGTLLAACTADIYEPTPDPEPDPTPEVEAPADNAFSTGKSKTLTVNVPDAYDGKYFYTVEAFTMNPLFDENAKMIPGSGQKTNSKVPYCIELNFPDDMSTVYLRVTDPYHRTAVFAYDVVEGENMVCNIGEPATSTKSTYAQLRSSNTDFPTIDYTIGSDCETISGKGRVTLRTNKTYMIPENATLSGNVSIEGGNVKIYVKGTWKISNKGLRLGKETSIYILDGGKIETDGSIIMSGTSRIAIQDGGEFESEDEDKNKLYMTDNTSIVNEGDFDIAQVTMDLNSSIYNKGDFDVKKLTALKNSYIVNMREFDAKNISMVENSKLDNFCKFEADEFYVKDASINVAPAAYMEVDYLNARGLTLCMDAKSMWVGKRVDFAGKKSWVLGSDTDYALFKVDEIIIERGLGIQLQYGKLLNIECKKHTQNNMFDQCYYPGPGVAFSKGQGFVKIDEDDCNNGGNHNEGTGEPDDDETYEETETLPYVYLFEDNWPVTGDYDMNDLVLKVEVMNRKERDKTKSVKIRYTLYATGATKQIGVGFQLDEVSASTVSGAEAGQSKAVVSLFSDAHSLLGSSERIPINTYNITTEPVVNEVTVDFNTPISGVINVNNFNLFIVTNGFDSDRRDEVHVAGYRGTDKASSNDNSTEDYVSNENRLMWALCIPAQEFATYPKETIRIDDAYEGFESWIKGDDTPGWYLNPIEDNVIKYDLINTGE